MGMCLAFVNKMMAAILPWATHQVVIPYSTKMNLYSVLSYVLISVYADKR